MSNPTALWVKTTRAGLVDIQHGFLANVWAALADDLFLLAALVVMGQASAARVVLQLPVALVASWRWAARAGSYLGSAVLAV
jgi:hypothetical protein